MARPRAAQTQPQPSHPLPHHLHHRQILLQQLYSPPEIPAVRGSSHVHSSKILISKNSKAQTLSVYLWWSVLDVANFTDGKRNPDKLKFQDKIDDKLLASGRVYVVCRYKRRK